VAHFVLRMVGSVLGEQFPKDVRHFQLQKHEQTESSLVLRRQTTGLEPSKSTSRSAS